MKLRKVLLGSGLAISSVAIPTATLTSCANSWGSLTPFTIGSASKTDKWNPWVNAIGKHYDVNNKVIEKYLQSNYAVQPAKSANYGYSAPMKFDDKGAEKGEWVNDNVGWYMSSDQVFTPTASDNVGEDKPKTVTNARNATLGANIDFIGTIGTTINNYLSLALSYQASQIKAPEKDQPLNEDDLNAAWGGLGLDHHGQTGDAARQFYELLFALSNLNGAGVIKSTLRTTRIGFNFEKLILPSYTFNGDEEHRVNLSDDFVKVLEGNDATVATLNAPRYWTAKSAEKEDDTEAKDKYITYTYESVPVKISIKGIEKRYVNTSKGSDSFLANDYYSNQDELKELVDNPSEMWKQQLPKFVTDAGDNVAPQYKAFTMTTQANSATISLSSDKDLRLGEVHGSDFIAVLNYQVNVFKDKPEKTTATLSGLANLFPAFLLSSSQTTTDLYKEANGETQVKIIDNDKVNKVTKKLLDTIDISNTEVVKIHASQLDDEHKKLLQFLGYMFGNAQGKVDTQIFIANPEKI